MHNYIKKVSKQNTLSLYYAGGSVCVCVCRVWAEGMCMCVWISCVVPAGRTEVSAGQREGEMKERGSVLQASVDTSEEEIKDVYKISKA